MKAKLWQYFLGFLIYLGFSTALPGFCILLLWGTTDGFGRRGFEEHFGLALILVLATIAGMLGGGILAFIRLRRSGRKLMADGMVIGLVLSVAVSWLLGYLEDREEAKLMEQQEQETQGWQPKANPPVIDYSNEVRDWEKRIDRPDTVSEKARY